MDGNAIDRPAKRFRVALSFTGEKREFVAKVAAILSARFGERAVLYDKYHEAEFARSDLAFYLPRLYREQSDLVVVIVCGDYESKEWTGLEWNAIFDLLKKRKTEEVILFRFDRAEVRGLFSIAGFVDLDNKTPQQAADCILERLALNEGKEKDYYQRDTNASPLPASGETGRRAVVAGGVGVRTLGAIGKLRPLPLVAVVGIIVLLGMATVPSIAAHYCIFDLGDRVYVGNGSDTVSVVCAGTAKRIKEVALRTLSHPELFVRHAGMAVTDDGRFLLISTEFAPRRDFPNYPIPPGTVLVLNTSTNELSDRIDVGGSPNRVAIAPSGGFAYVTNGKLNEVSIIDMALRRKVDSIPVGRNPSSAAITPDGKTMFVTNFGEEFGNGIDQNNVSILDTATRKLLKTVTVGCNPSDAATTRDGHVYITNFRSNSVSLVSDARGSPATDTFPVAYAPLGVVVSPDGRTAYVANDGPVIQSPPREKGNDICPPRSSYPDDPPTSISTISPIATNNNTALPSIPVGKNASALVITPDGSHVYATLTDANKVSVVSTRLKCVVNEIPVGTQPFGLAVRWTSGALTRFLESVLPETCLPKIER